MIFLATGLLQTAIEDPNKFNGYLILGYGVMWVIGILYLGYLYNRQRNAREDIHVLQKILRAESDASDA